jgi:FMN phosphatase YigB (HAD superfamily)
MPIGAVIFDIGGVLIQEMELEVGGKWDKLLGFESGEFTKRFVDSGIPQLALRGKISRQEAWERIGAYLGFSDEQVREYEHALWSQCYLFADMAQFLKGLRPQYKTATLSNDWPGGREENDRRFGLAAAISGRHHGLLCRRRLYQARSRHLPAHMRTVRHTSPGSALPR